LRKGVQDVAVFAKHGFKNGALGGQLPLVEVLGARGRGEPLLDDFGEELGYGEATAGAGLLGELVDVAGELYGGGGHGGFCSVNWRLKALHSVRGCGSESRYPKLSGFSG